MIHYTILTEAWKECKKIRQNVKRVISSAKEKKWNVQVIMILSIKMKFSNSKADGKRKIGYNGVKLSERSLG